MQRLGLISVLGLALVGASGAASAADWPGHAGGRYVAPAPRVYTAPAPRVYTAPPPRVYTSPAPRVYVAPTRVYSTPVPRGYVSPYAPARARVWVPGYWGLRGDTRVWVAGNYSYPPFAGWVWVTPQWAWNGYQWVWQEGYWAPGAY